MKTCYNVQLSIIQLDSIQALDGMKMIPCNNPKIHSDKKTNKQKNWFVDST